MVAADKFLRRMPIVAAIFKTYEVDPEDAEHFWSLVRDDNHISPGHPTRVLRRFLRENVLACFGTATRKNKGAEAREFLVKSIQAWNSYRRKKSVNLRYGLKTSMPKAV